MNTKANNSGIYVAFHIGRGGQFYNAGHTTFIGEFDFQTLMIKRSDHLFIQNRDEKGRFCAAFQTDLNGRTMVEAANMNCLEGRIEWDGNYDTDVVKLIENCTDSELRIIAESTEWKSGDVEEWLKENYSND